ncbi:hypothetical protein BKA56DRAFT_556052 [Neofusicoccum parvum]|nr:hypothetical protein BKA56DRAFT_556052 [Neofusicoccum parvum]
MASSESQTKQRLRCIVVGAGVSGILMAYKLQMHLAGYVDFQILEKSSDLGGTWYENRYPGCACDVPSHIYQYSFAPNPYWTQYYATSKEIQNYLKSVCKRFSLEKYIEYNSKVVGTTWQEKQGTWKVEVEGKATAESEILINAGGILNNFRMPDIAGLSDFDGRLLHTAAWDDSVDLSGKRVAIIGAGASAVQVLPSIQQTCGHVDVYIRTPSWISPPFARSRDGPINPPYTVQDMQRFRDDSTFSVKTRKEMENQFNGMFKAFFKSTGEQQDLRAKFESRMKSLINDEDLQKRLIPSFEVGCRRINPGESYLVALQRSNVQAVFEPIEAVVKEGIRVGGQVRRADVLIAATGFDTTFRPRFPIIGRENDNLQDLWESNPVSYMGMGVSGFPNYLIFLGPNTPISNGSLMGALEATSDYFIRILRKVLREGIRTFDVTKAAQQDFDTHTQDFMRQTVWTGSCRSWFKSGPGGKVTALWPGSSLQYMQVLAENKWENYIWTYRGNRFDHWGKGMSWIEDPSGDGLGIDESEALRSRTVPFKGADLSYYIGEYEPLPED